jgi:release factor glutamine methyltransferase
MPAVKTRALLDEAVKTLKASPAIDHWQKGRERIEANELLVHVLGDEPEPGGRISTRDARTYRELIERRATGEPIPYIKGYTAFRDIELRVEPGVFVPRDSSEWLAEQAIRRLRRRKAPVHVDLATGIGTIALAVADEVPGATVFGTDLSRDAVRLARKNAKRLGLDATFVAGDLLSPLPRKLRGRVDVITIHPPYVARDELEELPDEVRAWEPEHTLTDRSRDGLGLISRTAEESPAWLRSRGWLLVEVSPDRAKDVKRVLNGAGFRDLQSTKGGDLKITRVVVGRRPT